MRNSLRRIAALVFLSAFLPLFALFRTQEFPPQKPKPDYWSSFFSRTTRPLGLKENETLLKLQKQSNLKWALRTGMKHILR